MGAIIMDIKNRRTAQGLTLSDLARKVGVDPAHLHQVENYSMGVSDKIAVKVAAALGVGPKTLQEDQTIAAIKHQAKKLAELDLEIVKRVAGKNSEKAAAAVVSLTELAGDDALPIEMRKAAGRAAEKLLQAANKSAWGQAKDLPHERIERNAQGKRINPHTPIRRDPRGRRLGKDAYDNIERSTNKPEKGH